MSKLIKVNVELTDTFNGEANYGWVRRAEFNLPSDDTYNMRKVLKKVREELGLGNVKLRQGWDYHDQLRYNIDGCNLCIFILFGEEIES